MVGRPVLGREVRLPPPKAPLGVRLRQQLPQPPLVRHGRPQVWKLSFIRGYTATQLPNILNMIQSITFIIYKEKLLISTIIYSLPAQIFTQSLNIRAPFLLLGGI